jgi:hypothetical protein
MNWILIAISVFGIDHCWDTQANDFLVDDLGYLYTISDFSLVKHRDNGDTLFVYSRIDLGKISQVDLSNPLRPIVFYEETSNLCILDNTLSEQRLLSLWNNNFGMVEMIASGVNQQFWVYDAINKELLLVDERMEIRAQSGYLPGIIGGDIALVGMAERHEQLFIADGNYGIWIFDRFGTLTHRVRFENIEAIRAHADAISIRSKEGFYTYSYASRDIAGIDVSAERFDQVKNKQFIFQQNRICVRQN